MDGLKNGLYPPILFVFGWTVLITYSFSRVRPLKALALYVRVEQLFFIQLEDLTAPWVLEILYA